ncbi:hypothetical protein COCMIDRAFT_96438 [Bipolaris oryzae ATCC 44560]|uniref:Uncharacterized protein n=1 Tax=Bipolaris oryzae ATCC 44560 TaxID=930090 RepID=W6ZCB4_COCMI|nr:uncharacterized protein COCMIDRAFT_96438 [Bipolaris oryzae ATCC 44560]EUC45069.1 hypothetical protein COCMIDRAFT_96438 [Bipolaris oryzae ATCC 44560]
MSTSTTTTPRTSTDKLNSWKSLSSAISVRSSACASTLKEPSKTRSLWNSIKRHTQEHHQSLNAAYATYYGQGSYLDEHCGARNQEHWRYRRGGNA